MKCQEILWHIECWIIISMQSVVILHDCILLVPVIIYLYSIIILHHYPSLSAPIIIKTCYIACNTFLAATKQLYEWYFLSVCPSVRPSVRLSVCPSVCLSVCPSVTPFWLCSHHRIIMKFSGVITLDQGKVHAKGQGQRSKVKVTEVTTQIFVSGL